LLIITQHLHQFPDDLLVIGVGEGTLENLVDVRLGIVLVEGHLGVETLFNDVGGELELR
jgi:hypothetical protein